MPLLCLSLPTFWVVKIRPPPALPAPVPPPLFHLLSFVIILLYQELTTYKNAAAITVISVQKNASNFRRPNCSKNKKVKVSAPVTRTPAQIGILLVIKKKSGNRNNFTYKHVFRLLHRINWEIFAHMLTSSCPLKGLIIWVYICTPGPYSKVASLSKQHVVVPHLQLPSMSKFVFDFCLSLSRIELITVRLWSKYFTAMPSFYFERHAWMKKILNLRFTKFTLFDDLTEVQLTICRRADWLQWLILWLPVYHFL